MKIAILHLSDIHFKECDNPIMGRQEQIIGAIRSVDSNIKAVFTVLSGDIAFSGKQTQYNSAKEFLLNIQKRIQSSLTIEIVGLVAVPGNHDCDFDRDSQSRTLLIDTLTQTKSARLEDDSIIDTLASVQDEFFAFLGVLTSLEYKGKKRIVYQYRFNVGERNVLFMCFNTAWISHRDEKQGKLILPVESILERGTESSDLICAVFHHPYTWFESSNGRRFKRWIDDNCDIILTGHEHELDQMTQTRITGVWSEYLEGGILQADQRSESTFNVLVIDLADGYAQCYQFAWDGTKYMIAKQSDQHSLHRKLGVGVFENNSEYERYLNDPEVGFTHPIIGQVTLDDIFVYPDIRILDPEVIASGMPYATVSGDKLFEYVSSNMKVSISGSDRSGKTVLLKVLYKNFRDQGYVPLLISGSRTTSVPAGIERLLDESFINQYSEDKLEEYRQLDRSKKVVLVDDLHKLGMGYKGRCRFVNRLVEIAERVVTTTDELVNIGESVAEEGNPFVSFKHCYLPDLGYEVRGSLIEKWVSLGHGYHMDEAESVYKIKVLENTLDNLIRNRLLSSNPFIVLTALQILEGSVPSPNTVLGSYGYLYEFLITGAFTKTSKEATDLDIKYNFLSELANFMYDHGISEVSEEQFGDVATNFQKDYLVTIWQESLLQELLASRVLKLREGTYHFCYPYIYHYFVARYMRNILRDPEREEEGQQKLEFLTSNLHRDDCANIITFLCYLSPDPKVIEGVLEKARKLFSNLGPCQLLDDIAFLDKYVMKEPAISVVENDPRQVRQMARKGKDAVERERENQPASSDDSSDEDHDAVLFEVRLAFKTMQVMGQILRNFPGSLRGRIKLSLANECYQLGLRLLSAAMADLARDAEYLKAMYHEHIRVKHPKQSDKTTAGLAKTFVFAFAEMCARSVIKAISHSVGSSRLAPIYHNIIEQTNSLPVQIIDISIRLDHFKTIPEAEIVSTYGRIKHRALPATLLKLIVIDSLIKYPPSRSKRQGLLSKLGIKVLSPRLLLQTPSAKISGK